MRAFEIVPNVCQLLEGEIFKFLRAAVFSVLTNQTGMVFSEQFLTYIWVIIIIYSMSCLDPDSRGEQPQIPSLLAPNNDFHRLIWRCTGYISTYSYLRLRQNETRSKNWTNFQKQNFQTALGVITWSTEHTQLFRLEILQDKIKKQDKGNTKNTFFLVLQSPYSPQIWSLGLSICSFFPCLFTLCASHSRRNCLLGLFLGCIYTLKFSMCG